MLYFLSRKMKNNVFVCFLLLLFWPLNSLQHQVFHNLPAPERFPNDKEIKNAAFAFLKNILKNNGRPLFSHVSEFWPLIPSAGPSGPSVPQNNVVSVTKGHGLFLWIHLKSNAQFVECAKAVANIENLVEAISPQEERNSENEILYGIGFGPKMYNQLGLTPVENFDYPYRRGFLGSLPSTGGDIFVHAKSNIRGDLYYLAEKIQKALPPESVDDFSDTYGFEYRGGRDLSGFIDGTENPAGEQERYSVAVNKQTSGSFCVNSVVTQKWVHNFKVIRNQKTETLESWVGRTMNDSKELKTKSPTSHVARMTSGPRFRASKPFQIVRQSMPYGNVGEKAGLFFLAFAASPSNFEYMLSRMTGPTASSSDDIMRLSRCESGTYWYFPSLRDLRKLR